MKPKRATLLSKFVHFVLSCCPAFRPFLSAVVVFSAARLHSSFFFLFCEPLGYCRIPCGIASISSRLRISTLCDRFLDTLAFLAVSSSSLFRLSHCARVRHSDGPLASRDAPLLDCATIVVGRGGWKTWERWNRARTRATGRNSPMSWRSSCGTWRSRRMSWRPRPCAGRGEQQPLTSRSCGHGNTTTIYPRQQESSRPPLLCNPGLPFRSIG